MKQSVLNIALASALLFGGGAFFSAPAFSQATEAEVPEEVQLGIDTAKLTVNSLSGLAIAALVVALVPLGAMLTLRFLNMVLSRV
jgi:hypothetical protein